MEGMADPLGMIGAVVDGQYVIEELVGVGGLSLVYKARATALDAPVAIKLLNLPRALEPALRGPLVSNFYEACHLHYRLSQGNLHIARTIASGATRSPKLDVSVPYVVREWLAGHSLATDLARRRARGMKGRRLVEVIALFETAATAIGYAHARGAVHHGINPDNLFLATTVDGTALKVLDFGIGKLARDRAAAAVLQGAEASTQLRILHPAYAAPEQLDEGIGAVGPWTDVFALAAVLLEALGDTPVDPRPTSPSLGVELPPEIDAVLTRALALDPRQRPRDAAELWTALKNAALRVTESRLRVAMGSTPDLEPDVSPEEPRVSLPEPPTQLTTSVLPAEPSFEKRRRRDRALWGLAAAGLLASIGTALSYGLQRPSGAAARATIALPAPPAPTSITVARPPPEEASRSSVEPQSSPPVSTKPPRTASRHAPSSASFRAAAPRDPRFQREAAMRSLNSLGRILASCFPVGSVDTGEARVTFGPPGTVVHVALDPPFAGARIGTCVMARLGVARVPPFRGPPETVRYVFQIPSPDPR
jgi:serine/threonine protein kinase